MMAPGEAAALDFSKHDQNWELTKAHDLWILPVPGYPLAGGGHFEVHAVWRRPTLSSANRAAAQPFG
jgi:hypothetical protein